MLTLSTNDVFNIYNKYAEKNPPPENAAEFLIAAKQYGIGAGKIFSYDVFSDSDAEKIKEIVHSFREYINAPIPTSNQKDGWHFMDRNVSLKDDDIRKRAWVAFFGPGTNPVSLAEYLTAFVDEHGDLLDGSRSYILHMKQVPNVLRNGFWSVTPYNIGKMSLCENELSRYVINDRSPLEYNEDGSIDILLCGKRPSEERISNWLPVCNGKFQLTLRIYLPVEDVYYGEWELPRIKRNEA
ncbi:MAG: DUF1214 domain-containing protein [Eubacterium sp.]|nr:DUF1214 domain-containing protein [Eubacterium sp.]